MKVMEFRVHSLRFLITGTSTIFMETLQTLCDILMNPKMFMLSPFDMFFSLLDILEKGSDFEVEKYMPILAELINKSSHNSTPFVERIMKFIVTRFSNQLAIPLLDIILSFVTVLRDGFIPYASSAISLIVSALEANKSSSYQIRERVLDILCHRLVFTQLICFTYLFRKFEMCQLMSPHLCR